MDLGKWLKFEEVSLFLFSIYLFSLLDFNWWFFPLFLLLPDLGMIGYLVNNRIGAIIYNAVHHKALALTVFVIGGIIGLQWLQLIGVILLAHSSLDRVFDYGLKYTDDFKHTHLS